MPNCTSFIIFQWSPLLNIHSKCAAVIPFFIDPELFYNKLNSMKQSFSNTSELTKLHDLSIFFLGGGEDALNSPTKPIVAKLLFLFLYLHNYIICEIFSNVFWLIMLVCLRIWPYVHTGQNITHPSDKSCIYPWLKSHLMFLSNKQIHI